jgi:acetylornithine deacetylase/succinyl-diaminopimelate desuccinylase-like protein
VGTIRGGTGVNLVPDLVVLEIDRRLVPGESPHDAREELIRRIATAVPGVQLHAADLDPVAVATAAVVAVAER